jgi:hypothetical protein
MWSQLSKKIQAKQNINSSEVGVLIARLNHLVRLGTHAIFVANKRIPGTKWSKER